MPSPFSSISDIITQLTAGGGKTYSQQIFFFKDARKGNSASSASVAGNYTSLWMNDGNPSSGDVTIPGAAATCGRLTSGSLFQTDPVAGQLWCVGATAAALAAGTLIIYDRLTHMGGLGGTTTTNQLVSCSSNRYTGSNAGGTLIFVEIFTNIGATAVNINATYLNQDGTTHITPSQSIGGTGLNEASRVIVLPLATGDTGVTVVNTINLSATTGTAGSFGVFIAKPLVVLPIAIVGTGTIRDTIFGVPAIPQVEANACLAMMWLSNGVTATQIYGSLHLLEK